MQLPQMFLISILLPVWTDIKEESSYYTTLCLVPSWVFLWQSRAGGVSPYMGKLSGWPEGKPVSVNQGAGVSFLRSVSPKWLGFCLSLLGLSLWIFLFVYALFFWPVCSEAQLIWLSFPCPIPSSLLKEPLETWATEPCVAQHSSTVTILTKTHENGLVELLTIFSLWEGFLIF